MYLMIVASFFKKGEVIVGDFLEFNVSGTVVLKIIMIPTNNHFGFLQYLLHLCALYRKTAI